MALRVAERARRTWVGLAPREFDAVADLVAAFIESPEPQVWGHIDVVARVDAGTHDVVLVRAGLVLAMIEPIQPMLFAMGLPGDAA